MVHAWYTKFLTGCKDFFDRKLKFLTISNIPTFFLPAQFSINTWGVYFYINQTSYILTTLSNSYLGKKN